MGKCTNRKAGGKTIPLTDVSHSFLGGVRTRAKTLAAVDYLELRSRKLEKPPLSRKLTNDHFNSVEQEKKSVKVKSGVELEIEASFGENELDFGRNTRESTPNSSIRPADTITPPGSSTKLRTPTSTRQRDIVRNSPPAEEIEEFFARLEQTQQRRFIEKYNFDIVNDMPLPGRYEWEEVRMA